ncbi:unnamed protein product [Effrenium voratum]|uniref:Tail specific protease domain-containing protein n=1 Tax=Effrenium voratum TaxID=2562239 RepID=A0AA36IN05_9DINO|nr:unnamed protein product [Effrenium voratum]
MAAQPAFAQSGPLPATLGYVRQPCVSGRTVAFVAEEDLWLTDLDASMPRRLTHLRGASHPLLSPTANMLAFAFASDLWVMALADGQRRRLTWFGCGDIWPTAWIGSENGLAFASTCEDPFDRPTVYQVDLSGGEPTRLFDGEYDSILLGPAGRGQCLCRKTQDTASSLWKGYRGGMHGSIWLDADGAGAFKKVEMKDPLGSDLAMNISCLMWQQNRLFFSADPDGSGNLWSTNLQGQDLQKHTNHDVFDVRHAQSDPESVVYTVGGELWCFSMLTWKSQPLRVHLGHLSAMPTTLEAAEWTEAVALDPSGRFVSCLCRGNVYEMALWEGPAVRLLKPIEDEGARRAARCVAFEYLFSGRLLTVSDDQLPSWTVTIHPTPSECDLPVETEAKKLKDLMREFAEIGAPPQKLILEVGGQVGSLVASPVHDAVLMSTSRNELWLIEFVTDSGDRPSLEQPRAKTEQGLRLEPSLLDSSEWEDGVSDPCWSPDGRWIAYCRKDLQHGSSIIIMNIESRQKTVAADSTFSNGCPSFDPDGLYLAFLSQRAFVPVEDDITADLSFAHGADLPFLVLLQKYGRNPFLRLPVSPAKLQPDESEVTDQQSGSESESNEDVPKEVLIDVDDIQRRLLQFPVKPGRYGNCTWTSDGSFLYLREDLQLRNPYTEDEDEDQVHSLMSFDFNKGKEEELWKNVVDFSTSLDMENMVVCVREGDEDEEYFAVPAGKEMPGEEDEVDSSAPGPESGLLDMTRINLRVIHPEEWLQTFVAIKEFVKENLFDDNCGGLDWDAVCKHYRNVLPRIRSHAELTDLCREMLAELGLSHVSFSAREEPAEATGACLGVKASWQNFEGGGAYRVDELLTGDWWDPASSGPASRPGVGITVGSLILAVNRVKVCQSVSLGQMLEESNSSEVFVTYVPVEDIASFASIQQAFSRYGGLDGFRKLSHQAGTSTKPKKHAKRKDKARSKQPGRGEIPDDEVERKLAALFRQLKIDNGCCWRTARVSTAGKDRRKLASMRDLIERNGHAVNQATGGRIGYMHIPDTVQLGFAEFHRYFRRESSKDALIIDLRCNGGGFASELFLKHLQCSVLGWTVPRPGRRPTRCPELCTNGKCVMLVDDNTCSDAEAWAEAFKRFGLGKVIGVRTWGGVISVGAADLELIGGGELSLPDSHYYVPGETGYALENCGVIPDVIVECTPGDPKGVDPQLTEAIKHAMELLKNTGAPNLPSFPRTRLHRQFSAKSR